MMKGTEFIKNSTSTTGKAEATSMSHEVMHNEAEGERQGVG
jgi:deoxyribose-phosphate aldolase